MRNSWNYFVGAAALASAFFLSSTAQAGQLDACGNIFIDPGANCEILVEGGCQAQCEPFAFNASCAAEGSLGCSGSCDIDADVECTGSCQGSCEAECEVDPATFDCRATCEGNCSADCSSRCAADSDRAECEASCEATCGLECDAGCDVDPGEVDCVAQCQGCCSGECRAEINMDCQIDCQADLYVECQAELQGGCEAQCEQPEGALFCDGQFIEVSEANLDECIDALAALLDIEVEFEASASASVSLGCSVDDNDPLRGGGALLGFGLLCLVSIGRRRR
ncbi:hypothetical protein G6O69_17905 [Pseudenhygromyxa sp. WMMC2535]|uniref:hypothetical protein n=1 Tax=Pseudenhygromyxa sp. WMMC2535 TaxID=2712867 RepID=UPI001554857B|nr:hypothetical protein [Pseudenhygromyxa sp. WMMC2535]NVB39723.1 hypothetical protein [Pseudenhygromyxa sp. WMMC2535]